MNTEAGIKSIKVDVTATIKGSPDETWVFKADKLDATANCN